MIAINFTVFVELGLFLLFLWVTQKLILIPILSVMDRRDDQVESDEQTAEKSIEDATSLEQRYADDIAGVRRAASAEIEQARREGMMARAAAVRERKAEADRQVRAIEDTVSAAMDIERQQFDALVPSLADQMAKRLQLRGQS